MSSNHPANVSPRDIWNTLVRHRNWWIAPAVVGFVLAALYAVLTPREWKATQGVLIRPSAAGLGEDRLGKFSDLSEMKTLQETLLELARSKTVVSATLTELGPPPSWFGNSSFPSDQDVVDFREKLSMNPPGGAEFGKTEVFYLGYTDKRAARASQCVDILRQQLESRLKQIRDDRAQSMVAELANGVSESERALDAEVAKLAQFEAAIGDRLTDLRSIESPLGGQSQLAQRAAALEAELRQIDEARIRYEQLHQALVASNGDASQIIALPASLIASQPALERLKQGLIEAQLKTARLASTRQEAHPFVRAARLAEADVRDQLHEELDIALRGVELELSQTARRGELLKSQLEATQATLAELADKRAPYSRQLATVEQQSRLAEAARKRLTDAQVTQAGTQSASLLAKIDDVESGVRPVGPGRSSIAAAGGLAGLFFGLALTFVVFGVESPVTLETPAAASFPSTERFGFDFTPTHASDKVAPASPVVLGQFTSVADTFAAAGTH